MEKNPRVCVLLAAYNGAQWIEEQIQTIENQIGVELKLYISVDRSTDGTEEIVDLISSKNSNIFILPHGFRFGGAAQNFFRLMQEVDFSEFDFIAFSDQDDLWKSEKLKRACEIIDSLDFDAYSCNVLAFWPHGKKILINKSQPQVRWDYLFEAAGPGCTYVFSKRLGLKFQAFIKKNFIDIKKIKLHDWLLYAYSRHNGFNWYIDKEPFVFYRQHNINQIGANSGFVAFRERFFQVTRGWGLEQCLLIVKLLELNDNSFFKKWGKLRRFDMIRLSFFSFSCRRNFKDKFLFLFACLTISVLGYKKNRPS